MVMMAKNRPTQLKTMKSGQLTISKPGTDMSIWPKKAWSIEEELLKKKNKSVEEKYQSLLGEYQELRVANAKSMAKLRELERYKEISDDIVNSASTSRRMEEKERIEISSQMQQYRDKLEEAVENICFLEKENKRLKSDVTAAKLDATTSNVLLKTLDDSKSKLSTTESRLQLMRIEILELKNRKADLNSQVQDLKARLHSADTLAERKSDECKRLSSKLESLETAWDSTRSQNSRIQKEIRSVAEVADINRELSEKSKHRIASLENEVDALQLKLKTRERTIDLRTDNVDVRTELNVLKKDFSELQAINKDLRRLSSDHNKHDKDTEHALLRREVEDEMDVLKKPRVCKHCHESFTLEKNNAQSCTFHPGRYLPRQYPLEGYSWSCCCKRDISSRPCKFAGRHVERETL
ncbi:hypothetical protein DYB35_001127 [Aphanomyces astaci]|uniref:Uncharacterized protein n=4 Tax=Aphanomyces astaci TaxID=112090 RepID=A0A3R7E8K9_APHAT|nr:hypothetical protein DYB35_001127 [Aphanomyces astaci]